MIFLRYSGVRSTWGGGVLSSRTCAMQIPSLCTTRSAILSSVLILQLLFINSECPYQLHWHRVRKIPSFPGKSRQDILPLFILTRRKNINISTKYCITVYQNSFTNLILDSNILKVFSLKYVNKTGNGECHVSFAIIQHLLRWRKWRLKMVCGGFACSKNALAALNVFYIVSIKLK